MKTKEKSLPDKRCETLKVGIDALVNVAKLLASDNVDILMNFVARQISELPEEERQALLGKIQENLAYDVGWYSACKQNRNGVYRAILNT